MKRVTIDLAASFEDIVERLTTLPPTDNLVGFNGPVTSELTPEVQKVLRTLYEAAHGRQIETQIGWLPTGAPALAPFLKDKPFVVASQADFLLQALARLGRNPDSVTNTTCRASDTKTRKSGGGRRISNHQQQLISQATK